jgi:hypothetical protein
VISRFSVSRVREMFCKEPKNEAEFRVGLFFPRSRRFWWRAAEAERRRTRAPKMRRRFAPTPRPQAKLPARRTSTRSPRSMPTMPLLSATTALRRRRKKRCESICGNRFRIRDDQLENLGHRSGAFGRSGLRTRPLHVHDHGKRREEQNTNGKLPVGVAKAARRRLEDRGRYGHRGSAARATYAASAIYEIIHAGKVRSGRSKISWTICRIPLRRFVYIVEAGRPPGPKTVQEKEKSCRTIWLLFTSPTVTTGAQAAPAAATSAPFPVPESSPPHRPRAKYLVSSILGHTKKH